MSTKMPTTNRPFFANFFAAFRAHSALQKPPAGPSPSPTTSTATAQPQPSAPRSIHTKASQQTSQALQAASQHFANASRLPRSTQPVAGSSAPYSPPATPFARSRTPSATRGAASSGLATGMQSRERRGSDSSSDTSLSPAFRALPGAEALRAEKWYICGRTAGGEERFYKLGMVKRYRSQDRLSLDRISL